MSGRDLTVVIATRNRREALSENLDRLEALEEDLPVIVVDNGSKDRTPEAVRSGHPEVALIELDRNHGAAARNMGVALACTPYVAFCDDDSWWEPGALRQAVALMQSNPSVALVAARIHVGPEQQLDPTSAAMRQSPLASRHKCPGKPVLGFLACAAAVRRDAFLSAGGFHQAMGVGGEEQLLAVDLAAAGWQVAYVDELVVHHHPSPSARNPHRRQATVTRNALWFHWLRRPWQTAAQRTAQTLARALRDPAERAGLLAALRGLPWVLKDRKVVPPAIEADLRLVEAD